MNLSKGILFALLIGGVTCPVTGFSKDPQSSINALNTEIWQIQANQTAQKKQISDIFEQIKQIQGQIEKLNTTIQKQIQDMNKSLNQQIEKVQNDANQQSQQLQQDLQKQLKQLQQSLQDQTKKLNDEINALKKKGD